MVNSVIFKTGKYFPKRPLKFTECNDENILDIKHLIVATDEFVFDALIGNLKMQVRMAEIFMKYIGHFHK